MHSFQIGSYNVEPEDRRWEAPTLHMIWARRVQLPSEPVLSLIMHLDRATPLLTDLDTGPCSFLTRSSMEITSGEIGSVSIGRLNASCVGEDTESFSEHRSSSGSGLLTNSSSSKSEMLTADLEIRRPLVFFLPEAFDGTDYLLLATVERYTAYDDQAHNVQINGGKRGVFGPNRVARVTDGQRPSIWAQALLFPRRFVDASTRGCRRGKPAGKLFPEKVRLGAPLRVLACKE